MEFAVNFPIGLKYIFHKYRMSYWPQLLMVNVCILYNVEIKSIIERIELICLIIRSVGLIIMIITDYKAHVLGITTWNYQLWAILWTYMNLWFTTYSITFFYFDMIIITNEQTRISVNVVFALLFTSFWNIFVWICA